ncbi:tRNA methyltransferase, has a role in tRNA modification [Hanseniaspora vineae]
MSVEENKEEEFVHKVYNEIASHFSETRYKPWPIVTKFLEEREAGSIGIDVGCGNGKYLNINPNIILLGSDRSSGLIECAHNIDPQKYNVMVADGMHLPHQNNRFDFAISIAVVHHWSTRERRINAIRHIMSKVKSGGEILIYCWALEQKDSRRGYDSSMEQDVLVPWVFQDKSHFTNSSQKKSTTNEPKKSEKPDLTNIAPKDRAKYVQEWKLKKQQERIAEQEKQKQEEELARAEQEKRDQTKYRYYHLYKEGELEEDCVSAGGVIVMSGYERDNWYCVARKL